MFEQFIDLTYDICEGMTTFQAPWHPIVSFKQMGRIGFEGRETREIAFGTHTGTHMDAPLHFVMNGRSIDQIPLDLLIGEVTIIDFSSLGENEVVSLDVLGEITLCKRVVFKFGWGSRWGSRNFYRDYPFFSEEAAYYLIKQGVQLVGMDTPSPDDSRTKLIDVLGSELDSPVHKIFLQNGAILVEYLANLNQVIESEGWNICVLPLRLKGADGSPIRACIFK
jgi:arylformamidase